MQQCPNDNCLHMNVPKAKFCGRCGGSLQPERPKQSNEKTKGAGTVATNINSTGDVPAIVVLLAVAVIMCAIVGTCISHSS